MRPVRLLLPAALLLGGCIQIVEVFDNPAPQTSNAPVLPPATALPPADSVSVRLTDGSPGLALWCDQRSDCIDAARILCDNRQSIRSEFDIDRASPGAAEFFARSEAAPHTLTVSCPV